MTQTDLCALTDDDLATLTNRGTVKKAQKELDTGECQAHWSEDADGLTVQWSDGPRCHFAKNGALQDAKCTCVVVRLCRHIVRSVLDYRRRHAQTVGAASSANGELAESVEPWSPGEFTDEQLIQVFDKLIYTKAKRDFGQGILGEVLPGVRPMVRFEYPRVCVRFLRRADPRYTRCDQHGGDPCEHVLLAVWAARRLPAGQQAGLVSTPIRLPDAAETVSQLRQQLYEMIEVGISTIGTVWRDRLTRLERICRKDDLLWLAELIEELLYEYDRYTQTDARFDPGMVAALAGELLVRIEALSSNNGALPELIVRGKSVSERTLAQTQLLGLGCTITAQRKEWVARVYLHDLKNRGLAVLQQAYSRDQANRTFAAIGQSKPSGCPYSLVELSSHKIALATAKVTGAGWLHLPKSNSTQARVGRYLPDYNWEQLPEPLRQDNFAELAKELALQPPASLRARHAGADFRVCAVARCEQAHFDSAQQQLFALLRDRAGKQAVLVLPYYAAGGGSFDVTLQRLQQHPEQLRFVAGLVRQSAGRLTINPACLLFESEGKRSAVLPWLEPVYQTNAQAKADDDQITGNGTISRAAYYPLATFLADLQSLLGEVLLLGVSRLDATCRHRLQQLHQLGQSLGLIHLLKPIQEVNESFNLLRMGNRAEGDRAVARIARLLLYASLAHDIANT